MGERRRWFLIGMKWAVDQQIQIDVNGGDQRSETDMILAARRHGILDGSDEAQQFYSGIFAVLVAIDKKAREDTEDYG